jgi:DNA-binding HxlR family transcriptional regulator
VASPGAARKKRPQADGLAPGDGQTAAQLGTAARAAGQSGGQTAAQRAADARAAGQSGGQTAAQLAAAGQAGGRAAASRPRRKRSTPVDLDRLIHERVRLGIVSALAVNDTLSFNELKNLLGTTDGNLSVHARRLEDAGYVDCTKSFDGRMPRTDYRLTPAGRAALRRYLDHMAAVIDRVRAGSSFIFDG